MLKNIIIIENGKEYERNTLEEVVKTLIDENFYKLDEDEKKKVLKMKALANCVGIKKEIIEELKGDINSELDSNFIIKDEITYILSLLLLNKVIILENIDANIFTKDLDKGNIQNNYIVVNKFAKELLIKYLEK